jgi:Cu+-exporting ATPase
MLVAIDDRPAGVIVVEDPIKKSSKESIDYFHFKNIKVVIVTGDNRHTAEAVAKRMGIDEVEAEVLPEEKSRIVKKF